MSACARVVARTRPARPAGERGRSAVWPSGAVACGRPLHEPPTHRQRRWGRGPGHDETTSSPVRFGKRPPLLLSSSRSRKCSGKGAFPSWNAGKGIPPLMVPAARGGGRTCAGRRRRGTCACPRSSPPPAPGPARRLDGKPPRTAHQTTSGAGFASRSAARHDRGDQTMSNRRTVSKVFYALTNCRV